MTEPIWRRVLRFWRRDPAADIEDELGLHRELRIEEFLRSGFSRADAEAAAREQFGDEQEARNALLHIDQGFARRRALAEYLEVLWQEVRFGIRSLGRAPGFAAAVVLTLAIGIGANAAMFGILDRVVLSPPSGVRDPEGVGHLYFNATGPGRQYAFDAGNYVYLRALRAAIAPYGAIAGYQQATPVSVDVGENAWSVDGELVTGNYFELLGVQPRLGRFFASDEEIRGNSTLGAVISYGLWKGRFNGDEDVLGRSLRIRDNLYPIVAVAPAGFTGAKLGRVDLWLPLSAPGLAHVGAKWDTDAFSFWLRMIIRLGPTARMTDAMSVLAQAERELIEAGPFFDSTTVYRASLAPLSGVRGRDMQLSPEARVAAWLAVVAAIVLIIACANVANLFLLRAVSRRREIAIRRALGVGRARLAAAFLGESTLLALGGCVAALVCVWWTAPPLRAMLMPRVAWNGPAVDTRVLIVGLGCALVCALVAGLFPVLAAGRLDVNEVLKTGGPGLSARRSRLQGGFVALQAGLSLLLLVSSGLFVKSLANARAIRLGFDPDRVIIASVAFPPGQDPASIEEFLTRARLRLKALPGIEQVARSTGSPFGPTMGGSVRVPGDPPPKRGDLTWTYYNQVTPDFFAALGMRLVRGRTFAAAEEGHEAVAAVISAAIARAKWGDRDPIGKCFWNGTSRCIEVVGVVEDAHQFKLVNDSMMLFFLPLSEEPGLARQLYVRTAGSADRMMAPVRRALQSLSPIIPWPQVETMQSRVEPLLWQWKLGAWMLPLFGSLALIVACVGLYSVLAYSVTQRASELAIRSALGAGAAQLLRLVLADGARMVAMGLALGIVAALVAGRVLKGLLLGTSPVDWTTFAVAAVLLAVASAAATLIPAWRASRADPVAVLRTE